MWRLIHQWHRKIGITAAFFVMLLVITGLLLNHTDQLNLQNIFVKSEKILEWYDIQPKRQIKSFRIKQHWITQIDNRLYFDQIELMSNIKNLYGAVNINNGFVLALNENLLILTASGEIIEKISKAEGIPVGIKAIGLTEAGAVLIRTTNANYLMDMDGLEWQKNDETKVDWSAHEKISQKLYDELLMLYRGKGLPLERVILDIHSGRILGQAGVLLVDFMAILFLFLAISGVWMWLKYR